MVKIIHFVQNLSLDITAGSVISCLFVAEVFEVSIKTNMIIGLAIAIWLIYTIDHLLDAKKVSGKAINPRHAFHQKYFKTLIVLAVIAFFTGLVNCFYLPQNTLLLGFGLSLASALYFVYLKLNKVQTQKELFAALVYSLGVFTAPVSLLESIDVFQIMLLTQFFLLAYANLLLFPLYELETDVADHMNSIVRSKGLKYIDKKLKLVLAVNLAFVIITYLFNQEYVRVEMIVLAMTFALILLMTSASILRKYQLYRILGDGIFFLPALYFL